jgi:hypothetical protein
LFVKGDRFETLIIREYPSSYTQENVNIEHYVLSPGIMIWDVLRTVITLILKSCHAHFVQKSARL